MISAFQSWEFECVVCLFPYIMWSFTTYCLSDIMACFHHTCLVSNNGNKTFVQCRHKKNNARLIDFLDLNLAKRKVLPELPVPEVKKNYYKHLFC